MEPRDLMREQGAVLDRCVSRTIPMLIIGGVRPSPAQIQKLRKFIADAVMEGVTLGERYARFHSAPPPYTHDEADEDLIDTRPIRRTVKPPPLPPKR